MYEHQRAMKVEDFVQEGTGDERVLCANVSQTSSARSVAEALTDLLLDLGISSAFGITGSAIGPLWDALSRSQLKLLHFRHESGAAFAATEAYFASGNPVVVCVTTGPGITNVLTGLFAARQDGAKIILISGSTCASMRGRWPFQETGPETLGADIFSAGPLFHYAVSVATESDLTSVSESLAEGLGQSGGFVAHISLSVRAQTAPAPKDIPVPRSKVLLPKAPPGAIKSCVDALTNERVAIWLGYGSRHAAKEVTTLAQRIGSPVFCSPRAKGIFPEDHELFVGVTGLGGHSRVVDFMRRHRPDRTLVLGSRLGEMTSFWHPDMIPAKGLIHVDIDRDVPGAAYPNFPTMAITTDIRAFLREILGSLGSTPLTVNNTSWRFHTDQVRPPHDDSDNTGPVRPQVLMQTLQRLVVEQSEAVIIAEAGNAFAWATHELRFTSPGRYRVSTCFGSMGHAVTGVVGSAYANRDKAVALVGDGAMLMNNEISTAVQYGIRAVWVVLNDSGYGMCRQGILHEGCTPAHVDIPVTDFTQIARAQGAEGCRVEREEMLADAVRAAMCAAGPFVVDVCIDPTCEAPIGGRFASVNFQKSEGAE